MAKTKLPRGQQTEWIKECLAAGIEKPQEIAASIEEKHGHEVDPGYIARQKSALKARGGGDGVGIAKKKGRPVGSKNKAGSNGDVIAAVQAVRDAADKVGGMDKLKALVELMG